MPSVVSFTQNKRLIGEQALNQRATNSKNTILHPKRLMGRMYTHPYVTEYQKRYKVKVSEHSMSGKAQFEVNFKGKKRTFLPEQISAMILGKLKEVAEEYLGVPVTEAVITVPAQFDAAQKQATLEAGRIAGLNVLRVLAEPTAAGIAYGLDEGSELNQQKVLMFDLGGGTFDVSLLELENSNLIVKATNGHAHLGGEDFTQNIIDYVVMRYKTSKGKDFSQDLLQYEMLSLACERAKRRLSEHESATIATNKGGFDEQCITYTRRQFEEFNAADFKKCTNLVLQTLHDAKITKDAVPKVVLVGGSTRIPKIQTLLKSMFGQCKVVMTLNPDEAVAYGAAIQAAFLSCQSQCAIAPLLQDVVSLSLGIEIAGSRMSIIIPKNSTLPISRTKSYTTMVDNQRAIGAKVYQGERAMVAENIFLGDFIVKLQKERKGIPEVQVTFEINEDGILNVSAMETSTDKTKNLVVKSDNYKLPENEVKIMIEEAEKMAKYDREARDRADLKIELMSSIKNKRSGSMGKTDAKSTRLLKVLDEVEIWAQNNIEELPNTYRIKMNVLEDLFGGI